MINSWKVLWVNDHGSKVFRKFEGDKPTEAVEFAKGLKKRGKLPEVVSTRRAFPPPPNKQEHKPGHLWCPYCVKWRDFHEIAVRSVDGHRGPVLLRCPVCTVSIRDAYVRKYNELQASKYEIEQEMKIAARRAAKGAMGGKRQRG